MIAVSVKTSNKNERLAECPNLKCQMGVTSLLSVDLVRHPVRLYLNNRVLLSKQHRVMGCPRKFDVRNKSVARERSSRANMKFEHQISEGTYHT